MGNVKWLIGMGSYLSAETKLLVINAAFRIPQLSIRDFAFNIRVLKSLDLWILGSCLLIVFLSGLDGQSTPSSITMVIVKLSSKMRFGGGRTCFRNVLLTVTKGVSGYLLFAEIEVCCFPNIP